MRCPQALDEFGNRQFAPGVKNSVEFDVWSHRVRYVKVYSSTLIIVRIHFTLLANVLS